MMKNIDIDKSFLLLGLDLCLKMWYVSACRRDCNCSVP